MDFLDTKKMRRHALLLYTGYVFIGVAVLFSAIVLVYQANGFGVNKDGELVQNGLVFVSTQPNPAQIRLNGKVNEAQTNSRLSLPSGSYDVKLSRTGYHDWNRPINVQGGDVQNFDYPFLVPRNLQTSQTDTFAAAPGLTTQSRDRRWLVVQQAVNATSFNVYDLNQVADVQPEVVNLPDNIATAADGAESWEVVQWANDNEHFLVKHTYGTGFEYLLIDRVQPAESVNLNTSLKVSPSSMALVDNKFDLYHVLVDGVLSSIKLGDTQLRTIVENVLDFKSYSTDMVIYATPAPLDKNYVNISVIDDERNHVLRQVAVSDVYSLDTASYRGDQYFVVGASSEPMAYIYKNPVQQLRDADVTRPVADRVLRVNGVRHVSFSPNTQFVLAQNGQSFGVYDLFIKRPYTYKVTDPIDAPQQHAEWMDGFHLTFVSAGKQIFFDYDQRNRQALSRTLPVQYGHFSQDYRYFYSLDQNQDGSAKLTRTPLRTATDL